MPNGPEKGLGSRRRVPGSSQTGSNLSPESSKPPGYGGGSSSPPGSLRQTKRDRPSHSLRKSRLYSRFSSSSLDIPLRSLACRRDSASANLSSASLSPNRRMSVS